MVTISNSISKCAQDLSAAGKISLESQVRAYDLLDTLLSYGDSLDTTDPDVLQAIEEYQKAYSCQAAEYDETFLKEELSKIIAPLEENLNEARFKAAAAASLHEFTKETFEVFQTAGIFARRRALNELRQRAGFRLEARRIGNYVAKTFDLMNEANLQFAKAQQARFSADISYKISPDIYRKISETLQKIR